MRKFLGLFVVLVASAAAQPSATPRALLRDAGPNDRDRLTSERRLDASVEQLRRTACEAGLFPCDPAPLNPAPVVDRHPNLTACERGDHACNLARLTTTDRLSVDMGRALGVGAGATLAGPSTTAPPPPSIGVAENGSYYAQPNVNGVPKTVHVNGYYRKDGTYVREHYRSPPNSNPPRPTTRKK